MLVGERFGFEMTKLSDDVADIKEKGKKLPYKNYLIRLGIRRL